MRSGEGAGPQTRAGELATAAPGPGREGVMEWWPDWLRRWAVPAHEARMRGVENMMLRDALREAHDELRRHRLLLGSLRAGHEDVTRAVERVIGAPHA